MRQLLQAGASLGAIALIIWGGWKLTFVGFRREP